VVVEDNKVNVNVTTTSPNNIHTFTKSKSIKVSIRPLDRKNTWYTDDAQPGDIHSSWHLSLGSEHQYQHHRGPGSYRTRCKGNMCTPTHKTTTSGVL
jgi:hypothetical protein